MNKNKSSSKNMVSSKYKKRGQFREMLSRLIKLRVAKVGICIFAVLIICLIWSFLIPYEAMANGNARIRLQTPSAEHWFGTDNSGRDLFTRVIYGTRYSMAIGFTGTVASAFVGIFLGAIAGYYGKWAENLVMRFSEVLHAIPGLLLGMVIMAVAGNSFSNLIIAASVGGIPMYIRITRAQMLLNGGQEYVEAARAIGFRNLRIIFTQVLPNSLSPIIVVLSVNFGGMVMMASGLSFMGLGIPLPLPEWGSMISTGRDFARTAPYIMTFPGLFIILIILASNLIGDGVRIALDPKQKGRR